jgi:hypothetical protein
MQQARTTNHMYGDEQQSRRRGLGILYFPGKRRWVTFNPRSSDDTAAVLSDGISYQSRSKVSQEQKG